MPANLNVNVRTLFAPFDPTEGEFEQFVASAKHSIFMLVFGFHLPTLSDILIEKVKAGLRVGVILDHSQSEGKAEAGEVQRLVAAKVPLLIGTSPKHGQILHSKFTVIDEHSVEHGSWNYSTSAGSQSNDMHFVEHAPDYVRAYLEHWHRIFGFVSIHQKLYQPQGEVAPADVPAADLAAAPDAPVPAAA